MRIRLVIPGKPVPLARARATRMPNGAIRFYTPEESVKYQELIRRTATLAGCPLFARGCTVRLHILLPDRRVRDRDNVLKTCLDTHAEANLTRDTSNDPRGERNGHARLTESQVIDIRHAAAAGRLHRLLAAKYGVCEAAITHAVNGRTWKHLPLGKGLP